MLSFLILSGLLSNNTLTRLAIEPKFPSQIFAHQIVPVQLHLRNLKKYFPSYGLTLFPDDPAVVVREKAFMLKIAPQDSTTANSQVIFPRRGIAELPQYQAETTYPFGLIQKHISIPSTGSTVVYPALIPYEALESVHHRLRGEHLAGLKGESTHPYGIRDFNYGDSFRFIHWKSSAKQGEWKVKEFEQETRSEVFLDLKLAHLADSEPENREKAISVAASLLLSLSTRGFTPGLVINGQRIDAGGGSVLDAYLTKLALASPPESPVQNYSHFIEPESMITISDLSSPHLPQDRFATIGREQLERL